MQSFYIICWFLLYSSLFVIFITFYVPLKQFMGVVSSHDILFSTPYCHI